jgi:hypothetical protein
MTIEAVPFGVLIKGWTPFGQSPAWQRKSELFCCTPATA